MRINRSTSKYIEYIPIVERNNNATEDNWKKLDEGLTKIEAEWRKRIFLEKYSKEFIRESFRTVDDIDDLTVEELKCWYRLLNIKSGYKYSDIYFKNLNTHHFTEITIIYWIWNCDKEQYSLIDISFEVKNNYYKEQYGAIFLYDDIVLTNITKTLCKTDNTPIELEKRILSLQEIRI
jgi:hypothetical protein